jgi:preprotein translocase subunit SecA
VNLQAYGQKDPLVVYKTEGYRIFGELQGAIGHDVAHTIYRVQPAAAQQPLRTAVTDDEGNAPATPNPDANGSGNGKTQTQIRSRKIGPNEMCPCGSGKKYKHCHGAPTAKARV